VGVKIAELAILDTKNNKLSSHLQKLNPSFNLKETTMKSSLALIVFLCACTIGIFFSSCEPETIVETEIVTVNDTIIISSTDTIFISTTDTLFIQDEEKVTNFILVKHAEKSSKGSDPDLTQEGMDRAEKLASILSELALDKVYSTNYKRTRQTAKPTADHQQIAITNYGGFDHHQVIDDILENEKEGKVLIIGHSNTVPNFLNALTGTSNYSDLAESAYDNLYIVNTKSKGDSEVIHLKY